MITNYSILLNFNIKSNLNIYLFSCYNSNNGYIRIMINPYFIFSQLALQSNLNPSFVTKFVEAPSSCVNPFGLKIKRHIIFILFKNNKKYFYRFIYGDLNGNIIPFSGESTLMRYAFANARITVIKKKLTKPV